MDSLEQRSGVEIRAALIAAARTLAARDGKISLKHLYAESGIGRAEFYRCFSGKEALLAAIVSGDVQVLSEMAEAAKPQVEQRAAQGGGGSVVVAPPVDAWLERRLRVFERALSALESRQEKSERDLSHNVALLEEKLAAAPVVMAPEIAQHEATQHDATMLAPVPMHAPAVGDDVVFVPIVDAPLFEAPAPFLEEVAPEEAALEPLAVAASVEEEEIPGREIEDFIAHARVAAQRAAQQKMEPAHAVSLPRWIGWMGVVAVTVLVCVGLALGNVARATQKDPGASTVSREEPHDALGRMMALAASGDARAQTMLALAYLRGQLGAPSNDAAAKRWGLAAAQQGEPVAQYMVGTLYSKQDAAQAFSWFEQAALRGNIKAMHNLAIAYAQGQGTAEDDRRAAAWFNRAANQGYVDSQFDLAVLFERGQGVTQNRVAALKWYLIAARGGDGPSKSRAEQLRAEMPPEEAQRAEQLVANWHPQPRDEAANAVLSP